MTEPLPAGPGSRAGSVSASPGLPRSRDDAIFLAGAAAWALALGLLFFYVLVYVGHTAELAAYPYDVDQGEGYDINSGWLIAQGRPIYTDNEQFPYYSSNY